MARTVTRSERKKKHERTSEQVEKRGTDKRFYRILTSYGIKHAESVGCVDKIENIRISIMPEVLASPNDLRNET